MRRNSFQRQLVMDALKSLDHPTAQDVYTEIRKIYPQMSLGTVYRNLHQLAQDDVVRRLSFPDSPDRFDIHLEPHQHICCTRCGGYFNIGEASLGNIDRKVEDATGFEIKSHRMLFSGICPACRDDLNINIKKEDSKWKK